MFTIYLFVIYFKEGFFQPPTKDSPDWVLTLHCQKLISLTFDSKFMLTSHFFYLHHLHVIYVHNCNFSVRTVNS